jgi:hypothetical protein
LIYNWENDAIQKAKFELHLETLRQGHDLLKEWITTDSPYRINVEHFSERMRATSVAHSLRGRQVASDLVSQLGLFKSRHSNLVSSRIQSWYGPCESLPWTQWFLTWCPGDSFAPAAN